MRKFLTQKYRVVALVFAALGASAAIFLLWRAPIDFTYYEPTQLPAGVAITEKRISIIDNGHNRHESADLRLETVGWTYSIRQTKVSEAATIGDADQNFDHQSDEPTCSIYDTPKGTSFRLCHWVDDWKSHGGDGVSVYEVKFIKGDTYFWGHLPAAPDTPISVDDIHTFIDSFEQKSTHGIPIRRSTSFV